MRQCYIKRQRAGWHSHAIAKQIGHYVRSVVFRLND